MAKWIMVMTAGPFISATTTRFDELNRALSGFSLQSAFCAAVRSGISLAKSSSPETCPDTGAIANVIGKTCMIVRNAISHLHWLTEDTEFFQTGFPNRALSTTRFYLFIVAVSIAKLTAQLGYEITTRARHTSQIHSFVNREFPPFCGNLASMTTPLVVLLLNSFVIISKPGQF
jgi:hypothetical protein